MFRRSPGRLSHLSARDQVLRSVSSSRHLEPGVRFSRTRLTDVLHRRHSTRRRPGAPRAPANVNHGHATLGSRRVGHVGHRPGSAEAPCEYQL